VPQDAVPAPLSQGGMGDVSLAPQGAAPAPPLQKLMEDASLAPKGAVPAPPSHGGKGDASPVPQGDALAPHPLQKLMGDASLAPQGAAPAPPSQGRMRDVSLVPQGAAPAPPSQELMGDASLAPQGAALAPGTVASMESVVAISVDYGKEIVNNVQPRLPIGGSLPQSKKMPTRAKRFGRVVKGTLSHSKRQRTHNNQDVSAAPVNETIGLITGNDETHVPPESRGYNISQLRRKVRASAVMKEKLTQLVGELKNEVRELKRHAEESEAAHKDLVTNLQQNYWELSHDKQRDKKAVNDVSTCHLLLNLIQ